MCKTAKGCNTKKGCSNRKRGITTPCPSCINFILKTYEKIRHHLFFLDPSVFLATPPFLSKILLSFLFTFYFLLFFRDLIPPEIEGQPLYELYVLNQCSCIDFIYETMKSANHNVAANIDLTGNLVSSKPEGQPVITTRTYVLPMVLHKITIALKFMFYINSDLPIPAKKLQTPG